MNRFRTKKRTKDGDDIGGRPFDEIEGSTLPSLKPTMTFRRKKGAMEPEKPMLDLANALPSNDDFRTSLLMSGLSARFSMLREQDDPKTKIGKASDDSVLSPKRQSKMMDFGFQPSGLSDIAEVSSIHSAIRPPFASIRMDSSRSADGWATDDDSTHAGSIMSRAKPAHGNNLFGGRQKVYKIAPGMCASTRNVEDGDSDAMVGRVLYDDDLGQSAFQRLRELEKQHEKESLSDTWDDGVRTTAITTTQPSRPRSPPLAGHNHNRETTSTTTSGPSLTRSSTAATSVGSFRTPSLSGRGAQIAPAVAAYSTAAGLERTSTKSTRLYETASDNPLQNRQPSVLGRMDSYSHLRSRDVRTPSPSLPSPTDATFEIAGLSKDQDSIRVHSLSEGLPAESGPKTSSSLDIPRTGYGIIAPLSPPPSEGEDLPILPILPNDTGKATATGVFTRPLVSYDEQEYAQRQLQLQEGRASSPLRKGSETREGSSGGNSVLRSRTGSNATQSSGRSRSISSTKNQSPSHHANHFPSHPAAVRERQKSEVDSMTNGTFLRSSGSVSLSSLEDTPARESEVRASQSQEDTRPLNNSTQEIGSASEPHNAHTDEGLPQISLVENGVMIETEPAKSSASDEVDKQPKPESSVPSMNLGGSNEASNVQLAGMVRQHLRVDSNTSSYYGAPSPGPDDRFTGVDTLADRSHHEHSDNRNISSNLHQQGHDSHATDRSRLVLGEDTSGSVDRTEWNNTMHTRHTRSGSSATQKERDDFASELAERRRRAQESMIKSYVGPAHHELGGQSQQENRRTAMPTKLSGIAGLKSATSQGSLSSVQDVPSKAMRMLGISNSNARKLPPAKEVESRQDSSQTKSRELSQGTTTSNTSGPLKSFRQARRDAQRTREHEMMIRHQQKVNGGPGLDDLAPPPSLEPPMRAPSRERHVLDMAQRPTMHVYNNPAHGRRTPSDERSQAMSLNSQSHSRPDSRNATHRSESTERSRSRNGLLREELLKQPGTPGTNSSRASSPRNTPGHLSPDFMPASAVANRAIQNRSPAPGYFGPQKVQPIQTNQRWDGFNSGRPSPVSPYSMSSTLGGERSGQAHELHSPVHRDGDKEDSFFAARKRLVNKSEISEPSLEPPTSSHASIATSSTGDAHAAQVASPAPPLPPINPRRRQTRTQTMFGAFMGRSPTVVPIVSRPVQPVQYYEEASAFESAELEQKSTLHQKLRKSSSDGHNLHARARAAFYAEPSPALPTSPLVDLPGPPKSFQNMF